MKITAIRCFVAILCTLVASCAKEDPGIHHGPYVYVLEGGDVEIGWRTAEPAGSRVVYDTTRKFDSQVNRGDLTLDHHLVIEGFHVGRMNYFKASSSDAVREGRFTAGLDYRKGPYSQNVQSTSATLLWETNLTVDGWLEYGHINSSARDTVRVLGDGRFHEIELSGLDPGTTYGYRTVAGGVSSQVGKFRTPSPSDTSFTFLLYGDSRNNPTGHEALANRMAELSPAFTLHSGDFLKDGREEHLWDVEFFEPAHSLLLAGPIYPSPGNHEHDAPEDYKYFSVPDNGSSVRPEAWYDYVYGNAHFFVLDSNPVSGRFAAGSEQLIWLERVLRGATAQWKIAMFPPPTLQFRQAQEQHRDEGGLDAAV